MRKVFLSLIALITPISLLTPFSVLAQPDYTGELDNAGEAVYGSADALQGNIYYIIGSVISILISILGIIFLVLVLYAGYLWMTAGGNEKQVEKAKDVMIRATVGLVILLAAYSISNFVVQSLITAGLAG